MNRKTGVGHSMGYPSRVICLGRLREQWLARNHDFRSRSRARCRLGVEHARGVLMRMIAKWLDDHIFFCRWDWICRVRDAETRLQLWWMERHDNHDVSSGQLLDNQEVKEVGGDAKTPALAALKEALMVLTHPTVANRALPFGPEGTVYTNRVAVAVSNAHDRLEEEIMSWDVRR